MRNATYSPFINRMPNLFLAPLIPAILSLIFRTHAEPIADGAMKFLGNIIQTSVPQNYGDYWNQITLEDNGKWENVEKQRGQMNWSSTQNAYNYCESHDIPYRHHTFVWGEQYPGWMDQLSPNEQKAELEGLIKEFGEKFPNTAFIDVVNESLNKSPKWKSALGGDGETGYDWIVTSFELARKYCPNAKLCINEYYCEYDMERVKDYLKIVNILKEKELIDGIGIQTHDGETKKGYDMGVLKECIDTLATAGLPIYSTELDIAGNDDEQLDYYKKIFPILWEHPAIYGVTLWGWTDSWLLRISNPKDARLIINGNERPAMKWLREYVEEHKDVTAICSYDKMAVASSQKPCYSISCGTIQLQLDAAQQLSLHVVQPDGRAVVSFGRRFFPAGSHTISLQRNLHSGGCYIVAIQGERGNRVESLVHLP